MVKGIGLGEMEESLQMYYGFYPVRPLWVGEALSPDSWRYNFEEEMALAVLEHTNDDFSLYVCRDGMFVLSIESVEKQSQVAENDEASYTELGKYTNYINCIVLLFESTVAELGNERSFFSQEITTKEIAEVEYRDGGFYVASLPSYSIVEVLSFSRNDLSPEAGPEHWLRDRPVLDLKVFDRFFEHVDQLLGDYKSVVLMAQLMKSLSEYRVADKETPLILSWFIIETFLQRKWRRWLDSMNKTFEDGHKRINNKRFDKFKKGRDYPISVISNILELSDVISFELYKNIDDIRGLRNDIVHQDEERKCTYADCKLALQIAAEFMGEEVGFPLNLNLAFPMYSW